jgi:HPt (histidine-containing phosphotransfer) domain-containing protein
MRWAIAEQTAEPLQRAAHTLKSNGANFGATAFAQLCREMEAAARVGALEDAAARLAQIEAAYERVAAALQAVRPAG